jgi:Papain family cysteine protease
MDSKNVTLRFARKLLGTTLVGALMVGARAGAAVGAVTPPAHAAGSAGSVHALGFVRSAKFVAAAPVGPAARAGANALPASVDLKPWTVRVGNQGSLNSCVAWTMNYAMLGWYSRHDAHAGQPFAPMFAYSQMDGPGDAGAAFQDAFNIAKVFGNDTQSDYPQGNYDYKDEPTATQMFNAGNYKISDWHRLFNGAGQGAATSTAIKSALANNQPVALGFPVRPGFDNLGHRASAVDNDTTGAIRGGHAVLAVGYDAVGVLVQNSWGTGWANHGFGRLSWNVIEKDVWEGDTMDGFAIPTVQHSSTRTLFLQNGTTQTLGYGNPGDVPLTGDWNGDGIDTPGVFRDGVFYLRNTNDSGAADMTFSYGNRGDIPVVGDWNGDGVDTVGVARGGTWYLRNSNTGGVADMTFTYGNKGDIPVVGDWNGDRVDTIGVVRGATWYLRNSNTHGVADVTFVYGDPGDSRVVGDWNGDGIETPGVVRGNVWYLRNSNTGGVADITSAFDDPIYVPLAGRYQVATVDRPSTAH